MWSIHIDTNGKIEKSFGAHAHILIWHMHGFKVFRNRTKINQTSNVAHVCIVKYILRIAPHL